MQNAQMVYDNLPAIPEAAEMPMPQYQPARGSAPSPVNGIPMFEVVPIRKPDGTYENVEYVSIRTPGDTRAMPRHKVNDFYRQKYDHWYRLFRQGLEVTHDGTPLEVWPVMTPAQVLELKANNIFTVEQLAAVSDSAGARVPMIRTLKNSAAKWLESKKGADVIDKQQRENESLRSGMSMLEKQLADLTEKLEAKEHAEKSAGVPDHSDIGNQLETAIEAKRKPGRSRQQETEK